MSDHIDTSPAALRKLEEALSGTDIGTRELLYLLGKGVAAEKESNKCPRKNGECWAKFFDGEKEAQHQPEQASPDERHLRRLLALRAAIPGTYFDDGEAHGTQHGISIDFMREPVADIDAKLRALNVARMECSKPEQHHIADVSKMVAPADVPLPESCGVLDVYNMENVYKHSDVIAHREAYANAKVAEERERCAKLCDEIHAAHVAEFGDYLGASYAIKCKEAILANQKGAV